MKSLCKCTNEWAFIYSGDNCEEKKASWQLVAAIAGGLGLAVLILFIIVVGCLCYQRKQNKYFSQTDDSYPLEEKLPNSNYTQDRSSNAYDNTGISLENDRLNTGVSNDWPANHMIAQPNQMHWRDTNKFLLQNKPNYDHIDPHKDYSILRPHVSARPLFPRENENDVPFRH